MDRQAGDIDIPDNGVAITPRLGGSPGIVLADRSGVVVGYRFSPATGLVEAFRHADPSRRPSGPAMARGDGSVAVPASSLGSGDLPTHARIAFIRADGAILPDSAPTGVRLWVFPGAPQPCCGVCVPPGGGGGLYGPP